MHRIILFLTVVLCAVTVRAGEVKVTGGDGKKLTDLAGTPTMVTVVVKKRVEDKQTGEKVQAGVVEVPNLKVTKVFPDHFTTLSKDNRVVPFLNSDVVEVRLQGGFIEKEVYVLPSNRALRAEEQEIVDHTLERTLTLFNEVNDNQELKIAAAVLLTLYNNKEAADYLTRLADSNDLRTRIDASLAMYLAGMEIPESIFRDGFESGSRIIRSRTAILAGLVHNDDFTPALNTMMNERPAELAAPAMRALAKLGDREIIPKLLDMIGTLNAQRNEAAVFGLVTLGGPDIIEQMKMRLPQVEREERFRHVLVLYRLGDPLGRKLLLEIFRNVPTQSRRAALELATEQIFEVQQFLREELEERRDPTDCNLVRRAEDAAALVKGNDHNALAVLQELLRMDNTVVQKKVFSLLTELNERRLLPLAEPSVENINPEIAVDASVSVISMARPALRQRLLELRDELPEEDPCIN